MRLDTAGLSLIKKFESLHDGNKATPILEPQKDPVGLYTLGWGARYDKNGREVTKDTPPITLAEADALFARDVKKFEDAVSSCVTAPLNQNQFNALVCLAYNIGVGGFKGSLLLAHVNAGIVEREDFTVYNKAHINGVLTVLPGLTKRRNEEATLYGLA